MRSSGQRQHPPTRPPDMIAPARHEVFQNLRFAVYTPVTSCHGGEEPPRSP